MKTITTEGNSLYSVISEPGDATRYDYFVYHSNGIFCFMPRNNTFRYPQRLDIWDVDENLPEEALITIANRENCNLYTLKECIRTMEELYDSN